METVKKMSINLHRFFYLLFTLGGLAFLFFAEDMNWPGVYIALGAAFNPFKEQQFSKLSVVQKGLLIGQILLAMILIGLNIYNSVSQ